jgi:hypothetical protein
MQYHDHDIQRALAAERVDELRRDARRSRHQGRLRHVTAHVLALVVAPLAQTPHVELRRRRRLHT